MPWRRGAATLPLLAVCTLLVATGTEFLPSDSLVGVWEVELTASRLILLAGFAGLVATGGARRDVFRTGLELPLALLLAVALFSTLEWADTEPRFRFLVESVALFYLAVATVRTRDDALPVLAGAAVLALALAALPGLAQIAQDEATGFYRDGCKPVTQAPPVIPDGTLTRATGTFSNPNILAGFLLLLGPLAAFAAYARREQRLVVGLVVGLSGLALLLTWSRSAIFFALVAIGAGIAVSQIRHRAPLAAVGVALALGSTFLFAACGSEAGAGYGRTQEWKDTIELIRDNPVRGVGLGRVGDVLRSADVRANTAHAHNLFLNWGAEAGIGALVAWLWILGLLLWRSARAALGGGAASRSLFVALAGFTGFSLLDHPLNVDRVATAFWIVAALALAAATARRGETEVG